MRRINLSKQELHFKALILKNFEVNKNVVAVMKSVSKMSFEEIYNKSEFEKSIIKYLQQNCYDLKPTEIRYFFNHSKFDLVLAHDFLRRLYYQDINKRVNGMFIKTAIRFKDWFDNEFKMEKVG